MTRLTVEYLVDLLWQAPPDGEWSPKVEAIDGSLFRDWMRSSDIEVLGFLFATIGERRLRIEPPLDTQEYVAFAKMYLGRCFKENPGGEWSDSSYSAGWNLVGIFCHLLDNDAPQEVLADLKNWLALVYREGDQALRTCIENASLEHLFERKDFRNFFSNWKNDPILKRAYENARLWVDGGGHSLLSRDRTET